MRFRFYLSVLLLSLAAAVWFYQTGMADSSDGSNKIYLPLILAQSTTPTETFPSETDFIQSVINQKPDQVSGVYVPNVLAKPVVQQPNSDYNYISVDSNAVTQYALAATQDVTGLLAHNGLAGKYFFDLAVGQRVSIVYGSGAVRRYIITQILRYQAVEPNNAASDFIDPSSGERLSVADLFARVYLGSEHVTFQTCISQNGSPSWGRLFVIAEPVEK